MDTKPDDLRTTSPQSGERSNINLMEQVVRGGIVNALLILCSVPGLSAGNATDPQHAVTQPSSNTGVENELPYQSYLEISDDGTTLKHIDAVSAPHIITLPEGIEILESGSCSDLKDNQLIILPQTLTTIRNKAFDGSVLRFLRIPSSVTTIEKDAFCQASIGCLDMRDRPSGTSGAELRESYCGVLLLPESCDQLQTEIFEFSYYPLELGGTIGGEESPHASVGTLYTSRQYVVRGLPQDWAPDHWSGIHKTKIPPYLEKEYKETYPWFLDFEICDKGLEPIIYCKQSGEKNLRRDSTYGFGVKIISIGDASLKDEQWSVRSYYTTQGHIPTNKASIDDTGTLTTFEDSGSFDVVYTCWDEEGTQYSSFVNCRINETNGITDLTYFPLSNEWGVFDLQGRYLGESSEGLTPGIYVIRNGRETRKVVVR